MSEGPRLYAVAIDNDNTSSFEQVIQTVQHVFGKTEVEATEVARSIHENGKHVVGSFIYEIAETKVAEVERVNQLNNMQLQCYVDETIDDDLAELTRKLSKNLDTDTDDTPTE